MNVFSNGDIYKTIDLNDRFNVNNISVENNVLVNKNATKVCAEISKTETIVPLEAAVIGTNNTTIPIDVHNNSHPHFWTDLDAQEHYLLSKPTCYIVLGLPGLGMFSLGELIANQYKCIHICPDNVLQDEQQQNTSTWQAICFNLRRGRSLSWKFIYQIIISKMKSPAVAHRGYILTGFPLVNSRKKSTIYYQNMLSELAVIISQDIFEELITMCIKKSQERNKSKLLITEEEEEAIEPEEELQEKDISDEVYDPRIFDPCSEIINENKAFAGSKSAFMIKQTEKLSELPMSANLLINITCPDEDLKTKRFHKVLNYTSLSNVIPFEDNFVYYDQRWPPEYNMIDAVDFDTIEGSEISSIHLNKYNCRNPINIPKNVSNHINNYKNICLPTINKYISSFNSQYIFNLDGRFPVKSLFKIIHEKIALLPIRPVLIPSPLCDLSNMEESENINEFWNSLQEKKSIQSDNLTFNLHPSVWYNRCPVQLKYGQSIIGQTRYAVSFFNHTYLLSSIKNLNQFCRNPRNFLKTKYLKPTCRIIIIGSKLSGKTMASECLSWLLGGNIIDYNKLYDQFKKEKIHNFRENILSELKKSIQNARNDERKNKESERLTKLNEWLNDSYLYVKQYVVHEINDSEETARLKFPFLNDTEQTELIISDKNLLRNFAPEDLRNPIAKPQIPIMGDVDVEIAIDDYIKENNLESKLELEISEVIINLASVISEIELNSQNTTNGEKLYGDWIIDGFTMNPEFWNELLNSTIQPDYILCIIETREIEIETFLHYKNIENSEKQHLNRFKHAKDPLITCHAAQNSFPVCDFDATREMLLLLENLIYNFTSNKKPEADADAEALKLIEEELNMFAEELNNCKVDWDSVREMLNEQNRLFVEVEINDKSDIEVLEELLTKFRTLYNYPCFEIETIDDNNDKDGADCIQISNRFVGETSLYCPIELYENENLWLGKPEFSLKYGNMDYSFSSEENMLKFKFDPTKFQYLCYPFKKLPPLRICVIGCLGSGKSTISKEIAKELGLLHVDFSLIVNHIIIPSHFKNVGRKFENIFTDAPFDEEPLPDFGEDDDFDIFNLDETTMRKFVYNYFENGDPLPSPFLKQFLQKIWHEEPYISTGFVLDGFPRLHSDLEQMITHHTVPDLILQIESDIDVSLSRLSPIEFLKWKKQLKAAQILSLEKYERERDTWLKIVTKETVIKLLYKEIENSAFINEIVINEETEQVEKPEPSMVFDPASTLNVDEDFVNVFNEVVEIYPEPVYEDEWENEEDAQERINKRLESLFEMESGNIDGIIELVVEHKIKLVPVDSSSSLKNVFLKTLLKMNFVRNRNDSFFEQTFPISMEVADELLVSGYYFLSKFGKQCPVYVSENSGTIVHCFRPSRAKSLIFPVIHRSYIYFLSSNENMIKFRKQPLKYIVDESIKSFVAYPLRIGIIGPTKSGKSSLAARLQSTYGFIAISRGLAVRYVLDYMHWTDLAIKIKKRLRAGLNINTDLIMKSVELVANNHLALSQGIVFDGFPCNIPEAMYLTECDQYPIIIFDLIANEEVIHNHSKRDEIYKSHKYLPSFSWPLLSCRYSVWKKSCDHIRNWIANDFKNISVIQADESRWKCYLQAKTIIEEKETKIHNYLVSSVDNVISVETMCTSSYRFKQNSSNFKNFCPICLSTNVLMNSDFIKDRSGLIKYKQLYYWSCPEHYKEIQSNPEKCLILNNSLLPKQLPLHIKYYEPCQIYENGICIVTYAENLPAQKLVQGDSKFAVNYMEKVYLQCSQICLEKFMATPYNFFDITTLKSIEILSKINIKSLPHMGYLEQTLGKIITEGCCHANVLRPKYPGLGVDVSGLILIALYLKLHNPQTNARELPLYCETNKQFESHCKLTMKMGRHLRSRENPFLDKYPRCCHEEELLDSGTVIKPTSFLRSPYCECCNKTGRTAKQARRVPVPDERFDYLCEYHKPASKVPAFLNVVDIAGLVKGAAEGQGLGNAFLSHIKACDAIYNLCRSFEDEDVIHVDGEVNPVRDLETIGEELRLKDQEVLLQSLDKLEKMVGRGGDKKLKPEHDALLRVKTVLIDEKKHIRFGDWSAADIEVLNKYLFITSKPALYLINLSEKDYIRKKNKWLPKVKEWIDKNDPGAPLIPFSGVLESKLLDMDPEEAKNYLKENNITSALDKIIVMGYKALQLEYFFTAGADEVKAWTIQKGTKAPQAAGRIHTDFEKGFIMAEVMHYKDFKEEGSEAACKSAGKYRQQGRNYVVEDGDIIFFKFNAGAGLKDPKKK